MSPKIKQCADSYFNEQNKKDETTQTDSVLAPTGPRANKTQQYPSQI